jgi:hypothetical protein
MYTLAIEDTVEVPVKFTLKAGSVNKAFSVTLTAQRLSQDAITSALEEAGGKFQPFMQQVVTGWAGNRLILEPDTGEPADFSPSALEALLGVSGVAHVCFTAYIKECGAKEKN